MPNIEAINNTNNTASTQSLSNQKATAGVFSTLLSSIINQSTSSIADFSEDNEGLLDSGSGNMGLFALGSVLGGLDGTSALGNSGNMANALLLLLLLAGQGGSGLSPDILTALLGGGTGMSYNPYSLDSSGSGSAGNIFNSANVLSYIGQYQAASQLNAVPSASWQPSNPSMVNHVGERSADAYRAVISQFNVESSERYRVNKMGQNDTYCNIFLWDVTRAMGAEIPHYVNAAGEPVQAGTANAKEMNANDINSWLNTTGKTYGWVKVSPEEAQYYANQGMPAVTSWKNPSGHGHVQVVSPSADGQYNASRGVAIAQAGRKLYDYNYITAVYGSKTLPNVEYFVHI
jgi:hypothetical protein